MYEATRDFMKPFMTIGFTCDFDKILETLQPVIDKYLPIFNKVSLIFFFFRSFVVIEIVLIHTTAVDSREWFCIDYLFIAYMHGHWTNI